MKLVPLDPPLEEPLGNGTSVQITHVGRSRSGLPSARFSVWNGRMLAVDVIKPDVASERRRLAKAAAAADPESIPDATAVETAIMRCGEALHQLHLAEPREDADREQRPSANFPNLVDLVADDEGNPLFLVLDPNAPDGVTVCEEHTPDEGPDSGTALTPPPAKAIPWLLPRAAEVRKHIASDGDQVLFGEVVEMIKKHALLPSLPRVDGEDGEDLQGIHREDAYAEMLAAWEFHTHYAEVADYSAEIALCAVPERGKSRLGRMLTYFSRRGVHTETLREANLFRDSQDRGATLFLDCMNLWEKATKLGCEDILLQRFERGARVSRVLYPEKGPFNDTVYFNIYGPTILASNEPLGRILDTRCIPIAMPLAPTGTEYPVPREEELLPLRERLVAWRARQMLKRWRPEPMAKPASARLGDVLLPLAQIIVHVDPDRLPTFVALAKHLEAERRRDRSLSWEAAIVQIVARLKQNVAHGLLHLSLVAEQVNSDRPERERLSNRRIGSILRSLGLKIATGHANKAALRWDQSLIDRLAAHYAGVGTGEQKTHDFTSCVPHGEANQPIQPIQPIPAPQESPPDMLQDAPGAAMRVSEDRVVSIRTGYGSEKTDAFPTSPNLTTSREVF